MKTVIRKKGKLPKGEAPHNASRRIQGTEPYRSHLHEELGALTVKGEALHNRAARRTPCRRFGDRPKHRPRSRRPKTKAAGPRRWKNYLKERLMAKMKYRPDAPGGTMRRLGVPSFRKGGYEEGFPGSPRTMRTLPGQPLGAKKGGNAENMPGSPRTLRKLPCSIASGSAD